MMVTNSKKKEKKGEMKIPNLGHLFATSFYFCFFLYFTLPHFILIVSYVHGCSIMGVHFLFFLSL